MIRLALIMIWDSSHCFIRGISYVFSYAANACYGLLMGYKYSKIICKPICGAEMVLFASPFANIPGRFYVNDAHYFYFLGKLHIWFISYIIYFNLVPNLLIVSIWSLTFQYRVNLVLTINFWMKIDDTSKGQNKKLAFIDVTIQ